MEAWRTSCPRLPVWEEANDRGFIEQCQLRNSEAMVAISATGVKFLAERRQVIHERRLEIKGDEEIKV